MSRSLVLVLLLGLAACDSVASDAIDLGDPYRVQPSHEPVVLGDTLYVTVSYSGGCEPHTFDLGIDASESTVDLWLTHDANGDVCEALITEEIASFVPVDLAGRLRVFMVTSDTSRVPVQVPEAD